MYRNIITTFAETPRPARWIAAAFMLALLAGAVLFTSRVSGQDASTVSFHSVTPGQVADHGYRLLDPSNADRTSATVDRFQAEKAAAAAVPGTVIEGRLVVVRNLNELDPKAPWSCVCWAFSREPAYGWIGAIGGTQNGSRPEKLEHGYHLDFVDARTGEWIFAIEEAW